LLVAWLLVDAVALSVVVYRRVSFPAGACDIGVTPTWRRAPGQLSW
jgi:hypothetical protein